MMKRAIILSLVSALTLATGCATAPIGVSYPREISKEKVARVKEGVTTREELNDMFGEPEMKVPTSEGVCYFYKDLNLNSFWARFSEDWTLLDYEWSN